MYEGVTPQLDYCDHGYCETQHCRTCEIMGVCKACPTKPRCTCIPPFFEADCRHVGRCIFWKKP